MSAEESLANRYGGWAGSAYKACKEGAHGAYRGDLRKLVGDTRELARKVVEDVG